MRAHSSSEGLRTVSRIEKTIDQKCSKGGREGEKKKTLLLGCVYRDIYLNQLYFVNQSYTFPIFLCPAAAAASRSFLFRFALPNSSTYIHTYVHCSRFFLPSVVNRTQMV